jgi:hypothetical protein
MYDKRKENSDDALLHRIALLLVKKSDNALNLREFCCLCDLLQSNPRAREYYSDILITMADLKAIDFSPGTMSEGEKNGQGRS